MRKAWRNIVTLTLTFIFAHYVGINFLRGKPIREVCCITRLDSEGKRMDYRLRELTFLQREGSMQPKPKSA